MFDVSIDPIPTLPMGGRATVLAAMGCGLEEAAASAAADGGPTEDLSTATVAVAVLLEALLLHSLS